MSKAVDPARATAARIAEIVKSHCAAASTYDGAPDTKALQAWKYAPARMRPAGTVARRTIAAREVHGFVAGGKRAGVKKKKKKTTPPRGAPAPKKANSIAPRRGGGTIVSPAPRGATADKKKKAPPP